MAGHTATRPSLWFATLGDMRGRYFAGCFLGVALATMAGCTNEITAKMAVDGNPFTPTSCRSGQVNNFMGVDLIDDAGKMVRLVQPPTNKPVAILFVDGEVIELGSCGTMTIANQNSTINNIVNVEGQAVLECEAQGRRISGNVTFKNCH